MFKTIYLFLLLLPCSCFAQVSISGGVLNQKDARPLAGKLLKLKTTSDSTIEIMAAEKLYLQFDKPYYAINDTIWFKAYLVNGHLMPSDKSGIINADITNDSGKVIKQYRFPARSGLSWGNISLDEKDFTPGTYTLRAYTNWMRNAGDDDFYYKRFYISGTGENNMLVNSRFNTGTLNGNNQISAQLLFSDLGKTPYTVKPMVLQVMNGSRQLYKQKLQTGVDGSLDVNFKPPEKTSGLAIVAESEGRRAVIPVRINRPANTDLQFLPEGGSLVAGLPARVGFKAIGEDGRGVNVSGIIIDRDQKQVAAFQSLHNGMGSFELPVLTGESYTAKVSLPGGLTKEYPLPKVQSTGIMLQVRNRMESDSVEVIAGATGDIARSGESYFLTGKARGIVCYAAIVNFHEGGYVKRRIAKSLFPTGITHFTLLSTQYQPLNERLAFIDHQDNLNIKITADKAIYGPRDSIGLKIKVTDNEGKPVSGNFSLAVTDDGQVKTDTLNNENILSRLLLTSDLKGYVQVPGYYLSAKTSEAWKALDNMLLTQGWVGYDWRQVFSPPAIAYRPEKDFEVNGRVINVFNKPVKGTSVILFSKSPAILMDTVTDKDGKFVFDRFPEVDTPLFVIKAVNKNGKSFNVDIKIDEKALPDFVKPAGPLTTPWYVNSDSVLVNYTRSKARQENLAAGGHLLKEVKITAKKIVHGSQNLNGPGNADVVLDEKDLEKAGKKNFLQLLEENVKGFHEMELLPHYPRWYYTNFQKVLFIIDGVKLNDVYESLDFGALRIYLQSHNAEDIKGIEVMSSLKYNASYRGRFLSTESFMDMDPHKNFAFVEITSRSGHGPIIGNTPGMYLYKPLPLSWPKQFYKPKYAVKDTANYLQDLRSTIDWEPNITTGINGEAKVWFYTADQSSSYTISVEGTDMKGNIGYKIKTVLVARAQKKSK